MSSDITHTTLSHIMNAPKLSLLLDHTCPDMFSRSRVHTHARHKCTKVRFHTEHKLSISSVHSPSSICQSHSLHKILQVTHSKFSIVLPLHRPSANLLCGDGRGWQTARGIDYHQPLQLYKGLMVIYASSAGVISDTAHFTFASVYSHSAHQTLLISQLVFFLSTSPLHLQPSHSADTSRVRSTPDACQQRTRALTTLSTSSRDKDAHLPLGS